MKARARCRRHRPQPHATYSTVLAIARQGNSRMPLHDGGVRRHEYPRRRTMRGSAPRNCPSTRSRALENRNRLPARQFTAMIATRDVARQGHVGSRSKLETIARQYYLHAGDRRTGCCSAKPTSRRPSRRSAAMACRTRPTNAAKAANGVMPADSRRSSCYWRWHQNGRRKSPADRRRTRPQRRLIARRDDLAQGTSFAPPAKLGPWRA